jgi:hypothetical protein
MANFQRNPSGTTRHWKIGTPLKNRYTKRTCIVAKEFNQYSVACKNIKRLSCLNEYIFSMNITNIYYTQLTSFLIENGLKTVWQLVLKIFFPSCLILELTLYFILFVTMWRHSLNYIYNEMSVIVVYLCYFISKSFERCGAFVNLTYIIKHTVFLNKPSKIHKNYWYVCPTKIFKASYYTVLRAFSFKRIKILMTVPL